MAHTPGPWEARPNDGQIVLNGSNAYDIQEIFNEQGGFNPDDIRLMAAAPELLRTLRSIADDLGAMALDANGWREWDATQVDAVVAGALRRADIAIAKAEGRTDAQGHA